MAEISLAARILLALIFGVAAFGKARHRGSFRGTLLDLGFPPGVARLLTPLIIGCEALVAVLLASGIQRPLAALMAVGLLGVFAIISLAVHLSKRTVLCNCFGAADSTLGLSTIARSALLMVPAVAYAFLPTFDKATGAGSLETSILVGSVTAGFILVGQWILALPRLAMLLVGRRQPGGPLSFGANSTGGAR